MEIKDARFVVSNSSVKQCPEPNLPEIAFIGRSNVGKSSLINMLCNNKGLAKVSGTPGKTQLINHFIIDKRWYLVDLPGYGYAKAAKATRSGLTGIIASYLQERPNIMNLFVLVDSRHEPQIIDVEFMNWLGEMQIPFAIIFTKVDKLTKAEIETNIANYKQALSEQWEELPPMLMSSSSKGIGKEEILNYIATVNKLWIPLG